MKRPSKSHLKPIREAGVSGVQQRGKGRMSQNPKQTKRQKGEGVFLAGQSGSGQDGEGIQKELRKLKRKARKIKKKVKPRRIAKQTGRIIRTASKVADIGAEFLPEDQRAEVRRVAALGKKAGKSLVRAGKSKKGAISISADVLGDLSDILPNENLKKVSRVARRVQSGKGKKKRKLSKYNMFVKKHMKNGKSMKEVAAMWRAQKK